MILEEREEERECRAGARKIASVEALMRKDMCWVHRPQSGAIDHARSKCTESGVPSSSERTVAELTEDNN